MKLFFLAPLMYLPFIWHWAGINCVIGDKCLIFPAKLHEKELDFAFEIAFWKALLLLILLKARSTMNKRKIESTVKINAYVLFNATLCLFPVKFWSPAILHDNYRGFTVEETSMIPWRVLCMFNLEDALPVILIKWIKWLTLETKNQHWVQFRRSINVLWSSSMHHLLHIVRGYFN